MNIEKKLFKVSIKEILLITLILMIIVSFLFYVYSLISQKFIFNEILQKPSSLMIFVLLIQVVIQGFRHRKGLLIIKDIDKPENVKRTIQELLNRLDYIETSKENSSTFFEFKTKWKRTIELFYKGNIRIEHDINSMKIFGRRPIINHIETELKLDQ